MPGSLWQKSFKKKMRGLTQINLLAKLLRPVCFSLVYSSVTTIVLCSFYQKNWFYIFVVCEVWEYICNVWCFFSQVTMANREAAERACKDPNPIIDGRKANVNLAYLGAKPRGIQQSGTISGTDLCSDFQSKCRHQRPRLEINGRHFKN